MVKIKIMIMPWSCHHPGHYYAKLQIISLCRNSGIFHLLHVFKCFHDIHDIICENCLFLLSLAQSSGTESKFIIITMKKSETIAMYRDAFLEGKDEIDRRRFDEKTEDKQYAAVMAWKRRLALSSEPREKSSAAAIADSLKRIKKEIEQLTDLSPREATKIHAMIESISYDITNFDLIKKGRRLRQLKSQRQNLDREIELLENEGVKEC